MEDDICLMIFALLVTLYNKVVFLMLANMNKQ